MAIDMVIKNCQIVKPDGVFSAGIGIDKEKIVLIAWDNELPEAREVIDARGNYVIPGIFDNHVHLQGPNLDIDLKDSVETESGAAICGGITTLAHYVFTSKDLIKEGERHIDYFKQYGYTDLALNTCCVTEDQINQVQQLLDFGVPGFKLLLPYKGTEGIPGVPDMDDGIIYLACKRVATLVREGYKHAHIMVHCENVEIFFKLKAQFLAKGIEPVTWHEARPSFLEEEAMRRCIYIAKITDCPLYIVHLTIKEGVDIVAKAKMEGQNVIAESCPQYLVLNIDNTDRLTSKINPPIRTKEDNETLWQGIRDGVITNVCSDHAPTPGSLKKSLWDGTIGIPSMQTMLPIMLTEGVSKGRISIQKMVEVLCHNPAKIHGVFPQKGTIDVGSDADLVIIDMKNKLKVSQKMLKTPVGYSQYEGWEMIWPLQVILRGRVMAKNNQIVGKPGISRYVPARTN
jgi:dihydropyrimidinase